MNWKKYQQISYNKDVNNLLIEFLDNYKVKTAVDLGCGAGNETVYMIKKGIKVIAIDKYLNKEYILDRLDDKEKDDVFFINDTLEDTIIPKVDLVIAMYTIPFCGSKSIKKIWRKIYDSLNVGGFFICQLFGVRDDWVIKKKARAFLDEEIDEYLKYYEVLKKEEVEFVEPYDNKHWHFYNLILKKEAILNEEKSINN